MKSDLADKQHNPIFEQVGLVKYSVIFVAPVQRSHLLTNFLLLVQRKQVGYLASIQQVVYILQERFLFDLLQKSPRLSYILESNRRLSCILERNRSLKDQVIILSFQ